MRLTPAVAGLTVGFGAALLQAFFGVLPPPAYGICIACHMRDLVNWVLAHIYPIYGLVKGSPKIPGAPVSHYMPVLTIVGILIGATVAARAHGEFRWKVMRVGWQRPWAEFFWGMGVMICALMMGGCPVRTALKTAYLDLTALIGEVMIFVGVAVGCQVLRKIS